MGIPLHLLVVEDSEDDAVLLARELTKGEFDVSYRRVDTEEAMREALASDKWDLVITDHNMPSLDSGHALAVVKSMDTDVPIIVVSGSMGEEVAVAAMKSGAHDYIMKDNLKRLVPAVEREIREAESRRARRRAEETIHHMAFHDALTGLANRNEFEQSLKNALHTAKERNVTHVLLYLDLDQFKIINDTCGHIAGDELLRQLAKELQQHVREHDTLARLGGDEFGILLECCSTDHALIIAEALRAAIQDFRFAWQDKLFTIGVSIGLVTIDDTSKDVTEMLRAADIACYAAKDLGRNRIREYKPDDAELVKRHGEMQWVARINHALENELFILHRQNMAILSADTNIDMFEFLVRIQESEKNIILPGAFIPAAEKYDLMPGIDRWVIDNAFDYMAREYPKKCLKNKIIRCFINLSGSSLSDDEFFNYIRDKLKQYRVSPEMICFEVTETAAISNLSKAVEFIKEIKKQGFKFALDDFGSGLSSFSYLKSIPVDYLKIDGGFVINMLSDHMDCAFVDVINRLGHVAGLETIAEFVEDEVVMLRLKEMGVDYAQGYHIHHPESISSSQTETAIMA